MKKLFLGCVMPTMFLFIVWAIVFTVSVDDISNITNYHLDLYAMIKRFNVSSASSDTFQDLARSFLNALKTVNDKSLSGILINKVIPNNSLGFDILQIGLNVFFNPFMSLVQSVIILGYLIALIFEFLVITTSVATALFDFLFNPIFVAA